jgi:hypothetical protein
MVAFWLYVFIYLKIVENVLVPREFILVLLADAVEMPIASSTYDVLYITMFLAISYHERIMTICSNTHPIISFSCLFMEEHGR